MTPVVLKCGDSPVPLPLGELTSFTVPELPEKQDFDEALSQLQVVTEPRLIVVGNDGAFAAALTRLMRLERLHVELAYVTENRSDATDAYKLATGARAARTALKGTVHTVPLIRDDAGIALVGAATVTGPADADELIGEAYVDDNKLFSGTVPGIRIVPSPKLPGIKASVDRKSRWSGRRWLEGRAIQLGSPAARLVLRRGGQPTRSQAFDLLPARQDLVVGQVRTGAARSAVRPSPVFLGVVAITVIAGIVAWNSTWGSIAGRAGVFVLVVAGWVVTLCLHEFAHAYLAWRHGDTDVEARGYLTLNPLKYSHPMLSIGLPVLFIALGGIGLPGGAVYLRTGMFPPKVQARISLAGPFTNAVAAVILLVVIRTYGSSAEHLTFWAGLSFLAFLQVMATVLNLLPVPGLDGYNALEPYLAPNTRHQLDQFKPYGLLLLVALLFVPQINVVFFDAIYWIFELSGVSDYYAMLGNALMRFWT